MLIYDGGRQCSNGLDRFSIDWLAIGWWSNGLFDHVLKEAERIVRDLDELLIHNCTKHKFLPRPRRLLVLERGADSSSYPNGKERLKGRIFRQISLSLILNSVS